MSISSNENQVEGYNERIPGYDGPYLEPMASFNPSQEFQYAGSPTLAANSGYPNSISITPNSGIENGGFEAVVKGNFLLTTEKIEFGTAEATILSLNDARVRIIVPEFEPVGEESPGPVDLTITNNKGSVVILNGFTYEEA